MSHALIVRRRAEVIVHGIFHSSRDPNKIRELLEFESDEPAP